MRNQTGIQRVVDPGVTGTVSDALREGRFPKLVVDLVNDTGFGSLETSNSMGRGARLTDLNSQILTAIYRNILRNPKLGEAAANEFVKMVAAVPLLSAEKFADNLIALHRNKWKWDDSLIGHSRELSIAGTRGEIAAVGAIEGSIKSQMDATHLIRRDFLRNPTCSIFPHIFAKRLVW